MGDTTIRIEGLAKQYRIGPRPTLFQSLRSGLSRLGVLSRQQDDSSNTVWALKDISFDVSAGEVVGLIGRNGAGKSTLLKILTRITRPTSGYAEIHGRVGSLLEVGTGFHGDLTGRQNIYLNGAILGMRRAEIARRFDEIVAFAEVERFIDTPVKHYSSGMHARLAFSVAAHLDTEVLLVDEVLAVGDLAFQKKSLGRMDDMTSQGRTVLFVSHDLSAVTRLCSRAILLDKGEITRTGPATDVVAEYVKQSTGGKAFLRWAPEKAPGSAEVKLLSVEVRRPGGTPVVLVDVGDQLEVEMTYKVESACTFRCAVTLMSEGSVAFGTPEPTEQRREPGVYRAIVSIPPHLLAEREYTVAVSVFASRGVKSHHLFVKALAFQVTDALDGKSARGDYVERLRGVVAPKLQWRQERVE